MVKRRRYDGSLTGGTGDVNPQWLKKTADAATTTTFATTTIPSPRFRYPQDASHQQVIEILRVIWAMDPGTFGITDGAAGTFRATLSTKSYATTEPATSDGNLIDRFSYGVASATGGVGDAAITGEMRWEHDLTDSQGHGILVATDNMYLGTITTNTAYPFTSATKVCVWIEYRVKDIGVMEFVGIVTSQQ